MALAARRLARRRSFAQHRDISTLILLRHGTSEWNGAEARFSGWCDIPLTVRGLAAAAHRQRGLLYTSDAADEEDRVEVGGRRIIKK